MLRPFTVFQLEFKYLSITQDVLMINIRRLEKLRSRSCSDSEDSLGKKHTHQQLVPEPGFYHPTVVVTSLKVFKLRLSTCSLVNPVQVLVLARMDARNFATNSRCLLIKLKALIIEHANDNSKTRWWFLKSCSILYTPTWTKDPAGLLYIALFKWVEIEVTN